MKESSWKECLENNRSIKISPDNAKARSLVETAKERINFVKEKDVTEKNARFVLEIYYSSVLEMLHALVILKGFKVDNHICLGYYLKEIVQREDLFRIFDNCRYKRNSIVYYGKDIEFEDAKEDINKITFLIKEIENYL